MELLEGETLRGKLQARPIAQKQAVHYALQVAKDVSARSCLTRRCTGLAALAAELDIVRRHRDGGEAKR
jgi:hypothetical protein